MGMGMGMGMDMGNNASLASSVWQIPMQTSVMYVGL